MAVLSTLLATAIISAAAYFLYHTFFSPLASLPGPFLARYTNAWRLWSAIGRQPEVTERKLHDELGPYVRVAPNVVSINDPTLVPKIYSRQNVWAKGDIYPVHDLNIGGKRLETIFSTRDESVNTNFLKPVTKLYSMGYMVNFEYLIDNTIDSFLSHLEKRFAQPGVACDLHNWFQYVAFEVISELSFGKQMGFMEHNGDQHDILRDTHAGHDYVSVIQQMPWLDYLFERNPIMRIGPPVYVGFSQFCGEVIGGRLSGEDGHNPNNPDMLDSFLEVLKDSPPEYKSGALMAYVGANVGAGSDTVAGALRTAIYYTCKNPAVYKKLRDEIDTVTTKGAISWATCQELPYLKAVLSEAFRIMPGVGYNMERRVGPEGLALPMGTFLPAGTQVGVNAHVMSFHRGVFGEDAHIFRPERWLKDEKETEAAFQARSSAMRQADLNFGAGKRSCFGRNIALIECHKIVASFVKAFDFKLVHPEKKWKTHNGMLMRQSDMDVVLTKRL